MLTVTYAQAVARAEDAVRFLMLAPTEDEDDEVKLMHLGIEALDDCKQFMAERLSRLEADLC